MEEGYLRRELGGWCMQTYIASEQKYGKLWHSGITAESALWVWLSAAKKTEPLVFPEGVI